MYKLLLCVQGCVRMYYFLSFRASTSAPSSMNSQTTRPEMFWRRPSSTAKTWWLWSWLWTRPRDHISLLMMKMWVHTGTDAQSKTQTKLLWFSHSFFNYRTETLSILLMDQNTSEICVSLSLGGGIPFELSGGLSRSIRVGPLCVLTICQLINPSRIRMWSHLGIN